MLLYFSSGELVSLTGAEWKAASSITTHTPHTLHQCLSRLSHQKRQLYAVSFSITCHYLAQYSSRCIQCGPIVQSLRSPPTRLPLCFISSCLCSFSISPAESDSSQLSQSFTPCPSHLLLLYTSITICTDAFSSALPSGVAALTLIEISIHHKQRPIKM